MDQQNRVCQWQDQSGNDLHVLQKQESSRPKGGAQINGQPAIDVDPGQTLFRDDVLGIDGASGRSIIAVYALDSLSGRFTISQGNPGSNSVHLGLDDNTYSTAGNLFGCYVPNGQAYDGDRRTDAKPHVRAMILDSLQTGLPSDATAHCITDGVTMKLVYRCCDSSMKIGDFRTANRTVIPAAGDAKLAEVLVYDRPLDPPELQQLTSKLAARYGIVNP